jgi:hypothetical protein
MVCQKLQRPRECFPAHVQPCSFTDSDPNITPLHQVLKWGEALHDYDVSLAEGSYTVVVLVMTDEPKQVVLDYNTVFVLLSIISLQLEDSYKHTVKSTGFLHQKHCDCFHQVLSASIALENALDCFISLDSPHASSSKEQSITLHGSQEKTIYITPPLPSKIPKVAKVNAAAAAAAAFDSASHLHAGWRRPSRLRHLHRLHAPAAHRQEQALALVPQLQQCEQVFSSSNATDTGLPPPSNSLSDAILPPKKTTAAKVARTAMCLKKAAARG